MTENWDNEWDYIKNYKKIRIKGTDFEYHIAWRGQDVCAVYKLNDDGSEPREFSLPMEICEVVYEPVEHTYQGKDVELCVALHGDEVFIRAVATSGDQRPDVIVDLGAADARKLADDITTYYRD